MNHIAHLDKKPYDLIKDKVKHYEYRLNDEKRQKYKIDDTITFHLRNNESEKVIVIIKDLKYYKDLYGMYHDTFNDHLYKIYNDVVDAVNDTSYYKEEEIKKYGCIAIKIEVINQNTIEKIS